MSIPESPSKELLELIYNNTNDLIFLLGVEEEEYRCLSVNRRYLESTGAVESDLTNRLISEIFSVEDNRYLKKQYDAVVTSKAPYHTETRTQNGGVVMYLDTTFVPIFVDEVCTYIIGVSRDATERISRNEALKREKQKAENYLNIAEAMIVALDPAGNIQMLNRKGYRMLGYPEGTLTGENYFDLVINDEGTLQKIKQDFLTSIEKKTVAEQNVAYVNTRFDERILMKWANSVIYDQQGDIIGVLASGEDITERRKAEKAMIANHRYLAAGEIVSGVAHDFNNALQGIMGNLDLVLTASGFGDEEINRLKVASNMASDAAERIKILQRFSSEDEGSGSERYHLNHVVQETILQTQHLWRDEAQRRGIEFQIIKEFESTLPESSGNVGELRSALYNVLKNSIEAMPDGGKIKFKTWEENSNTRLTISDSGSGMDQLTGSRIFQPFFSTKGFESGRGLGLSASLSIVRSHGGELRVKDTAPGVGTTIEVILPIKSASNTIAKIAPDLKPRLLSLLWVDDDDEIRDLAKKYIKRLGHEGLVVNDGDSALQAISERRFDVVITDLGMAGMSGFDLSDEIHQIAPNLPVIALSGWGHSVTEAERRDHDLKMILPKPISLKQMGDALLEVFTLS